ncbi:2-amino-3-ketobutyrate coenzyme A ligase, mitochondrial [Portunus trituberculatus]|uniref:2-amino-3-ketobutyrate coenzyme A ligase, mitochondrial n=2 Tax=Portunus trituberculatus TaxID=210409 RepID=A0A5B7EY79_PORTR|nr:2-amino-3-ketobutyrate coenzyme A ligase, mitochondrial [Portunus trituberculatus]
MLERGIFVIGFSFPVVRKGKARIRVQISASHSFEDIDGTVEAFKQVGKSRQVFVRALSVSKEPTILLKKERLPFSRLHRVIRDLKLGTW